MARPDPLTTYRAKRDFAVTSEPTGSPAPSLDPGVRRMAVHVEDHPLEYADFEGVIPGGEYGAGDVIVWDRGTWTSSDRDPAQALHDGELHVELRGEKLRGGFVLVRTTGGRRAAAREQRSGHIRDEWLMIHRRDDDAVEGWDAEDHPRSVRSGRTNDEVAASPASDRWTRDRGLVTGPTSAEPSWDAATPDELEALSALGRTGSWRIGERELRLTNLDKVLFPASGRRAEVTKRDLIAYVAAVAPAMMPYLAGRPVNLHRFPDGADRPGFWQKAVPSHAPAWLSRWRNEEADPGETEWYLVPDGAASLAWMANWGALEWHPWTSTTASPHEPTWALIDIDPGDATTFAEVRRLARRYRDALATLELDGRPKTTGKRGLQIWVPIEPGHSFDDTRRWVEAISLAVARLEPGLVSWSWRTDERGGLARLDYTQNAINKTLVAPFSPRAAAGAPVSVPLAWDDLDDRRLRSDRWSVHDVLRHVRDHGDPLRDLIGLAQPFPRLGGGWVDEGAGWMRRWVDEGAGRMSVGTPVPGQVRIGCSGWSYREWRGRFYPPEMPARRWFEHYASVFDTVELNATFYRLPAASTVEGWARQAPPGFCYAVKLGAFGTHRMKLRDPAGWLARHLERARLLGDALGPTLVQLPPRWHRDVERLDEFLAACPGDLRWAVELRDPSWLHDDVYATLRRHGAALCWHDLLPGVPIDATAGWAYVRLHGPDGPAAPYRGVYGAARLQPWANRIRRWRSEGVDVHVYFDNDVDAAAPGDASLLRTMVSGATVGDETGPGAMARSADDV